MNAPSGEQLIQITWRFLNMMYAYETEKLYNMIFDRQRKRLRKVNSSMDTAKQKIISDTAYCVKTFLDENMEIFLRDTFEFEEQRLKALKTARLPEEKVFYVEFFIVRPWACFHCVIFRVPKSGDCKTLIGAPGKSRGAERIRKGGKKVVSCVS